MVGSLRIAGSPHTLILATSKSALERTVGLHFLIPVFTIVFNFMQVSEETKKNEALKHLSSSISEFKYLSLELSLQWCWIMLLSEELSEKMAF